jgi:hypothetical protein
MARIYGAAAAQGYGKNAPAGMGENESGAHPFE